MEALRFSYARRRGREREGGRQRGRGGGGDQVVELVDVESAVDVVDHVVEERAAGVAPAPRAAAVNHLLDEEQVALRQRAVGRQRHVDAVGADGVAEHAHRHVLVAPGGEGGARGRAGRVLQREAARHAFELVAEGPVAEVVAEAGQHHAEAIALGDLQAILLLLDPADELAGAVAHAK